MKPAITMPALAAAGVLMLSACGASDPTESEEYVAMESDAATAQQEARSAIGARDAVQVELDEVTNDLDRTRADLKATEADLAESEQATAAAIAATEQAEAVVAAAEKATEEAVAEANALREEYDPQIRAALQAGWDAEVLRACGIATAEIDRPIEDLVEFDASWKALGAEADLIAAVDGCAAPERNKTTEQREADRLAAFGPVSVDEVVKNPDAYNGTGVVMFANIVQWDTNTGTCSFHANFRTEDSSRRYDFDERAQFGYGDSVLVQSVVDDCPALDGIDVDDTVKVWATGGGAYSYSTSIGGTNTVPVFSIEKIELIRKD